MAGMERSSSLLRSWVCVLRFPVFSVSQAYQGHPDHHACYESDNSPEKTGNYEDQDKTECLY